MQLEEQKKVAEGIENAGLGKKHEDEAEATVHYQVTRAAAAATQRTAEDKKKAMQKLIDAGAGKKKLNAATTVYHAAVSINSLEQQIKQRDATDLKRAGSAVSHVAQDESEVATWKHKIAAATKWRDTAEATASSLSLSLSLGKKRFLDHNTPKNDESLQRVANAATLAYRDVVHAEDVLTSAEQKLSKTLKLVADLSSEIAAVSDPSAAKPLVNQSSQDARAVHEAEQAVKSDQETKMQYEMLAEHKAMGVGQPRPVSKYPAHNPQASKTPSYSFSLLQKSKRIAVISIPVVVIAAALFFMQGSWEGTCRLWWRGGGGEENENDVESDPAEKVSLLAGESRHDRNRRLSVT